jgi:N-hydroxyarylamine O-acetyltransferase
MYLARIGYRGSRVPSAGTLRALHVAHLETVPFENLDIGLGRPIRLDEQALFDKIVTRRRGGFCYELNGLFGVLLRHLGFRVALLSAGVLEHDGTFGPDFDHMTLLVQLEDRWLADVGFGDGFREPLRLDEPRAQVEMGRCYRVTHDGRWGTMRFDDPSAGPKGYRFSLVPRHMAEYDAMCRHHQTSPESPFTQRRVCSRATPDGRVTLTDTCLIVSRAGRRDEVPLTGAAWEQALEEHFGIRAEDLAR